jgi:hypothetical protein
MGGRLSERVEGACRTERQLCDCGRMAPLNHGSYLFDQHHYISLSVAKACIAEGSAAHKAAA